MQRALLETGPQVHQLRLGIRLEHLVLNHLGWERWLSQGPTLLHFHFLCYHGPGLETGREYQPLILIVFLRGVNNCVRGLPIATMDHKKAGDAGYGRQGGAPSGG